MSAVSCCCIALYILHLGFFIVCKPLFLVASSFSLFFFSSQLLMMDFFFSCIALFLLEWLFFFSLSFPLFSRHRCNGDCRGSGPLSGRVRLPFASAPPAQPSAVSAAPPPPAGFASAHSPRGAAGGRTQHQVWMAPAQALGEAAGHRGSSRSSTGWASLAALSMLCASRASLLEATRLSTRAWEAPWRRPTRPARCR